LDKLRPYVGVWNGLIVHLPDFSKSMETLCGKGLLGHMTSNVVETNWLWKYLAVHFCTIQHNKVQEGWTMKHYLITVYFLFKSPWIQLLFWCPQNKSTIAKTKFIMDISMTNILSAMQFVKDHSLLPQAHCYKFSTLHTCLDNQVHIFHNGLVTPFSNFIHCSSPPHSSAIPA